jgi:hypothetical protein
MFAAHRLEAGVVVLTVPANNINTPQGGVKSTAATLLYARSGDVLSLCAPNNVAQTVHSLE